MKRYTVILALLFAPLVMANEGGCDDVRPTSDEIQRRTQERILAEGVAQVGMPAIKNFREKKLLKDILELRDQDGLVTYSYVWSEMQAKMVFLCDSIGYGIPYATQFTNPLKSVGDSYHAIAAINQADPNGLFSPSSADGTWVMCKDPGGSAVRPVYVEPRMIVSPFKLDAVTTTATVHVPGVPKP